MRIIFVYNLKCARTTLNKVLNNGGLKGIVLMTAAKRFYDLNT